MEKKTVTIDGIVYKTGDKVTCELTDQDRIEVKAKVTDGKIYVAGEIEEELIRCFICQNKKDGAISEDKLGYKYSWAFHVKNGKIDSSVKNLQLADGEKTPKKRTPKTKAPMTITIGEDTFEHGETVIINIPPNYSSNPDFKGGDVEAILCITPNSSLFLCQDYFYGAECSEKFGKKYSWVFDVVDGEITDNFSEIQYIRKLKTPIPNLDLDDDPMPADWVCDEKIPIDL
jgi:hypothetical protein